MENTFQSYRDEMQKGFDAYCFEVYKELTVAYREVTKEIDDNAIVIETQLDLLSTHLARIKTILASMDYFLDVAVYKKLTPKGEMTELDRKAKLDFEVAEERCIRNKVKGLVDSVETRISVLQSRLKSARLAEDRQRTGL